MPAADAHVPTTRADRYLTQLCEHLDRLRRGHFAARLHGGHSRPPGIRGIERAGNTAVLTFDWGRCTLTANPAELVLHAEGVDEDSFAHALGMLTRRVETIGRRERLAVTWKRTDGER